MYVKIDYDKSQQILASCLKDKIKKTGDLSHSIRKIIFGSHKTYKYVLVTGLLAKATNQSANAISLQAKAPIDGAYDARSLCHKVVVPFERDFLSNALGGSNEPYLNKPARYTHLSADNPVRAGHDRDILDTLITVLSSIRTSHEAYEYLSYSFTLLQKVIANNAHLHKVKSIITVDLVYSYTFVAQFVKKSFEGESCAIVVGAIEKQFYSCIKGNYKVITHKVNQSGASSKEIGDVDVYKDDEYLYSIEVKDKSFSAYDLEHAFKKIMDNSGKKGAFIYGPRATYDNQSISLKLRSYEQKKFITLFYDILKYAKMMLFQTPTLNLSTFMEFIISTAIEINCKNETMLWIHEVHSKVMSYKSIDNEFTLAEKP